MSDIVIRIENLSKRYRIGERKNYYTLRDAIAGYLSAPLRLLRRRASDYDKSSPDHFWALDDVSFEVKKGEVVGIIGRNGAGKSTLFKILSRITEPTKGYARIHGRLGALLEVGTGFHPELTGRENIYLSGSILGMKRAEISRKFDEIVAFAEIEKFIDTSVKFYSSGMYVRLAFAVAAHLETEILLVDEVLAVGDASFQKKCLGKMGDVARQGRTVLFVSHNMPAVTRLCERTILLGDSKVQCDGPSHQVVSAYLRSGVGTTAMREWPDVSSSPGNDVARLCGVRVLDESGNMSDSIDIGESVSIEVEYYNFSNNRFPNASVQLYDENDICLFTSGDFNNLDWRHKPRTFDGRVISSCRIPGNFLSEGLKRVLVALINFNPDEVIAIERDAVSFMVVDRSEGNGARGEFAGYFPGVVRPLLEWRVDSLNPAKKARNF